MSDFYGSVSDADAYHEARANSKWAGDDAAKTAALVRASSWIDATYGLRFPGTRAGGREQVLAWPRVNASDASGEVIADDEVPAEIERATYEAALREIIAPGSLSPDLKRGGRIKSVGAGSARVEYMDGAPGGTVFTSIEGILASLVRGGTGLTNFTITRA